MTPHFHLRGAGPEEEERDLSALLELLDYFLMESRFRVEAQTLRSQLLSPDTEANQQINDHLIRDLFGKWGIPCEGTMLDHEHLDAPFSRLSYVAGAREAVKVFDFVPPVLVVQLDLTFTRDTVVKELKRTLTEYREKLSKKSRVRIHAQRVRTLQDIREVHEFTKRGLSTADIQTQRPSWSEDKIRKHRVSARELAKPGALAALISPLSREETDRKYDQVLSSVTRKCLSHLGLDLNSIPPRA